MVMAMVSDGDGDGDGDDDDDDDDDQFALQHSKTKVDKRHLYRSLKEFSERT